MKTLRTAAVGLGLLFCLRVPANADSTFTQVGTWSCSVPPGPSAPPPPPPYICPAVSFPEPFGGTPTVILNAANDPQGYTTLRSVSPTGFTYSEEYGGKMGRPPYRGNWIAVGPKLEHGTVIPKYLVLTVIYAPPGSNGGKNGSSVSYAAGSTTGTKTEASQSFKNGYSVSFEGSGGFLGNGGGAGLSFDWSSSTMDSQSLEIKKSVTSTISRSGPSQDGVNHDEDTIYLLLNPTVNLDLSSSSASWVFANTSSPIQYVFVGWLNGHETMPAAVAQTLQNAGISAADYSDILARDPLASGSGVPDPARFVLTNTTYPYEPPLLAGDTVPTVTTNIQDSSTATVGTATQDTYKVGMSISTSGDYLEFAKATLKDTASWEWTNKVSQTSSSGTTQSATVTVGGPAFGYSGPTVMQVYTDAIYHTFAFALEPLDRSKIAVRGTALNSAGNPRSALEVTLTQSGVTHHTFTNAKGEFYFRGPISGPATVQAAGVTQAVRSVGALRAEAMPAIILRVP